MPTAAERAKSTTMGEMASRAHLEVLAAGRGVIAKSSPTWRRVTDSDPCGFCAMLASRGPVYGSEDAAAGSEYHSHCGCTAEPADGDDWQPTGDEQRFIEAYESVHQSGMTGAEAARLMDEWLKNPVNVTVTRSIESLSDDAVESMMVRMMESGDYDGADRLGELLDARQAALKPKPWWPDPYDALNPTTFKWFEDLDEDSQFNFLDALPASQRRVFGEQQWAHMHAESAPKLGTLPTERMIRAEWDAYIEVEWVRMEAACNGQTVTPRAVAAGHRTRDLLKVNEASARKWASEEVLRYWERHGRMSYDAFKAGIQGGAESLSKGKAGRIWA